MPLLPNFHPKGKKMNSLLTVSRPNRNLNQSPRRQKRKRTRRKINLQRKEEQKKVLTS
jgi:hypothetical protein